MTEVLFKDNHNEDFVSKHVIISDNYRVKHSILNFKFKNIEQTKNFILSLFYYFNNCQSK